MNDDNKDIEQCTTCKSYHRTDQECPSVFTVFHEGYLGIGGKTIRAYDAKQAAHLYTAYYNGLSGNALLNGAILIEVADRSGIRETYKISAELFCSIDLVKP